MQMTHTRAGTVCANDRSVTDRHGTHAYVAGPVAIAVAMEDNRNAAEVDNLIHLIVSILHSQLRRYRLVDNVVHFRNLRQAVAGVLYALRHGQLTPAILGETQSSVAAVAHGIQRDLGRPG